MEGKNVLLITNAVTESEIQVINESLKTNRSIQIKLSLVHVIPNLPTCYFNIPSMVTLAEQYYEEAKRTLTSVGETLEVAKKNQWLITGRLKSEVLRLANKLNTQFILASSSNIQDFHKSFLRNDVQFTDVRNVKSIGTM
jgi:hypothetical protein